MEVAEGTVPNTHFRCRNYFMPGDGASLVQSCLGAQVGALL